MADNWDSNAVPWNASTPTIGRKFPVFTVDDLFYQADSDKPEEETGSTICSLERIGIPLVGERIEPSAVKLLTRVWLVIQGTAGDEIQVYLGAQEATDQDSPEYLAPETFTIGTDNSVDGLISGRYGCIKLTSTDINEWTLVQYKLDFEVIGRY